MPRGALPRVVQQDLCAKGFYETSALQYFFYFMFLLKKKLFLKHFNHCLGSFCQYKVIPKIKDNVKS